MAARNLARRLVLQHRVSAPDGLGGSTYSWVDVQELVVTLTPASAHVVTQATLRGQAATHTAILPVGVVVEPLTHRLIEPAEPSSTSWMAFTINRASSLPQGIVLELEAKRVTSRT